MVSKAEECLSGSLRSVLADLPIGAEIPDTEEFRRNILGGLEWFVPDILHESDPGWCEALDGVVSARARKTGEDEAEIVGFCWLLPGGLEPIHTWLQTAEHKDEVSWLLCYFGEKHQRQRKGRPPRSADSWLKRMHRYAYLDGQQDLISWTYKVTYGEKRER